MKTLVESLGTLAFGLFILSIVLFILKQPTTASYLILVSIYLELMIFSWAMRNKP